MTGVSDARNRVHRTRVAVEAARARDALKQAEARNRVVVDASPALIWMAGPDRTRRTFNRSWLTFRGRTQAEEQRGGWWEGVHPDDRRRYDDAYGAAFELGEPIRILYRLRRHDGEFRWIQEGGTPWRDAVGRIHGWMGQGLDISERVQLARERDAFHEAVARGQKMEAVKRLAEGVSHDLNNLFTGLLGYCDLLLASLPPGGTDRADVAEIQSIVGRGSVLTRQLLAFSGRRRHDRVSPNLTTLVSGLKSPVEVMVPRNVDVVWDLATDLPDAGWSAAAIEEAVYALVNSAVDAMPGGGRLTIRTSRVTLDERFVTAHPQARMGDYVALAVEDTGSRLEAEVLERILDPLFTPKAPGAGPELAAVSEAVESCGGTVIVDGPVGSGTAVTMYFPVEPARVSAGAAAHRPRGRHQGATVLVLERDDGLRTLVRRLLEGHGFVVLEATDGADAIARWGTDSRPIDLLLMDVVMSGPSGPEVARAFRDARRVSRVLLMSGYENPALLGDLQLDERTAFILKPYFPRDLVDEIRRLLDLPQPSVRP